MEKVIFAFLVVGLISVSATPAKFGTQCPAVPSTIPKIAPAGRAVYQNYYEYIALVRLLEDQELRTDFSDILEKFIKKLNAYSFYSRSIDDQEALAYIVKLHPLPATYLQALADCKQPLKDEIDDLLESISYYAHGFQEVLFGSSTCHCGAKETIECTSDSTHAMRTQISAIITEFIWKDISVFFTYLEASICIDKVLYNH